MSEECIKYFNGDTLPSSVWVSKYKVGDETTPDDMHWRMSKDFFRVDKKNRLDRNKKENAKKVATLSEYGKIRIDYTIESIYEFFKDFRHIVPQGSIMAMLGNKNQIGCLSNCFVIGQPEDSYGGILKKDQELVQLMKRRGGVGIDISTLRPSETAVTNSAGTSTGAVSFMERFSNSTREVGQNGRRGALMLTIDVRHPDVFDFVNIKKDRTKVTGANISVLLRDDFMEAVKKDEDYILRFPCDKNLFGNIDYDKEPYNELICDGIGYFKKIKAKELYDSIVENAWDNAEPGQMFVDKHWDYSPDGVYKQYRGVTTNPCGEIFMQMYDACRLMALNLYSFVDKPFTKSAKINYKKLYEMAYEQQRLADNLVDLEIEHINRIILKIKKDSESEDVRATELALWQNIKRVASSGRRTGCGITALGDMLAALGLPYDSDKALKVIDKVFKTKMRGELDCSIDLAIERGPFKGFNAYDEASKDEKGVITGNNSFYEMLRKEFPEQYKRMIVDLNGRRNVSWSTVAPTGSVSILTQTTSGLEPLFQAFYMRRVKVNPGDENARIDFVDQNGDSWTEHAVLHPKFELWLLNYVDKKTFDDFALFGQGLVPIVSKLPKEELQKYFERSPWYGCTANDIDWEKRIEIQSIIQKYTSHSISSTINLPNSVTKEEVANIYIKAYENGLKGVTIYRDGCRTGVLVNADSEDTQEFTYTNSAERPKTVPVDVYTTVSKGVKWNVFVGLVNEKPYEVFATPHFTNETRLDLVRVKSGHYNLLKDNELYEENITEKMNDEQEVITRLASSCLRHRMDIKYLFEQLDKSHGDVTSFGKAVARTLKRYIPDGTIKCNECGEGMILQEGCMSCPNCGNSKC